MRISTFILSITLMCGTITAMGQEPMSVTPKESQTTDVSNQELEKFANVYTEVQSESQKMQADAVEMIKNEGMEVERFNELANAKKNPEQEVEANEEEMAKINTIGTKIQKLQADFQQRVAGMIQEEGLTVQRYQEVYQAIQKDQELQQKFGKIING